MDFQMECETYLQMEGAGRYRHWVHEHVESMLAYGSRHELRSERARARGRYCRRHRRSIGTYAPWPLNFPLRPLL